MKNNRWIKGLLSAVLFASVPGFAPVYAEGEQPEDNTEETQLYEEEEEILTETAEEETPKEEEDAQEALLQTGAYDDISSDEASIRGFVVRLYRIALEREPDTEGFEYWENGITKQTITGTQAVKGFFSSKEMTNRNLSDEQFVRTLYKTVLNREADAGGLKNWTKRLEAQMTREYVMNGILNSAEFNTLCKKYGVLKGTAGTTKNYRDKNYNITVFVGRMYSKVLGRKADVSGLEGWCKKLVTDAATGADLIVGFFLSPEYLKKKTSNEDFVKTAYRAIFDREADTAGYKGWLTKLKNKMSRREVLAGFVESKEYLNLCAAYGIKPGSLKAGWKTENGKKYYYKADGTKAMKEILTINGKRYAFNAKGIWIGDKSATYLQVFQKAINLVNEITTNAMTDTQKLRACFDVFAKFREGNPWIPHYTGEGWVEKYANHCFDNRSGNCMSYAVCFAYMAKVLGYEEIYCCNSGGHGWAEIGGLVYDPEWTLHRAGNFFGRPLGTGSAGDPNYKGAIMRVAGSNQYVKL